MDRAAQLSLGDLWKIMSGARLIVLGFSAAGGLVAVVIAFSMRPIYHAQVLLAPVAGPVFGRAALAETAEQLALVPELAGGMDLRGGVARKEIWIATLRSRRLTASFIRENNLLPELFSARWDASVGHWKLDHGKSAAPTMEEAFELFDSKVRSVNEDRRTGLVTLSIDWHDRHLAARWANDLVARTNDMIRARAVDQAERSLDFLKEEFSRANTVEQQRVIYTLRESKTNEIMLASAREEYAFEIIDPAVASESGHYSQPRRVRLSLMGVLSGLTFGAVLATLRWLRQSKGSTDVSQAGDTQ